MHRPPTIRPDPIRFAWFAGGLRSAFTLAILCLCMCVCGSAWAQTSGSVSLVSDYLFRGISLSDDNPALQANVAYDSPGGWYAGMFATQISMPESTATAQLIGYGGYSHRLQDGWSWEIGATESLYVHDAGSNYVEVFAGLSYEHVSGRIYYAPNYFGQQVHTVYSELNATYPLFERFHLLAHAGYLRVPPLHYSSTASRIDTSLGIGATFGNWEFQLAWVTVERSRATYTHYGDPDPRTGVASVSYSF